MKLSEDQRKLLLQLKRSALSFTGCETDAQRLAMLQLYMAGLVTQSTRPEHRQELTWMITCKGEACVAR
ncbi:hypothetical protein AX289_21930 [Methylorubrum populi]|nr:hypothetical protein AX289_21930 [Methylorubrum populi]